MEELDHCDYCVRRGRKKNLARLTFLPEGNYNHYCPDCLQTVIHNTKDMVWVKDYIVTYPYKKGTESQ